MMTDRKFNTGDQVLVMNGDVVQTTGEILFHSGWDEWLGTHRYKVRTCNSSLTFNETSLRPALILPHH